MSDIAFKSDHSTDAGHVRRAPLDSALYTFVLLALSLIGPGGAAANADVAKAPIATARPGLSFAVADFDGDLLLIWRASNPARTTPAARTTEFNFTSPQSGSNRFNLLRPRGGSSSRRAMSTGTMLSIWFSPRRGSGSPSPYVSMMATAAFRVRSRMRSPGAFSESKTNWTSTTSVLAMAWASRPSQAPALARREEIHCAATHQRG